MTALDSHKNEVLALGMNGFQGSGAQYGILGFGWHDT